MQTKVAKGVNRGKLEEIMYMSLLMLKGEKKRKGRKGQKVFFMVGICFFVFRCANIGP